MIDDRIATGFVAALAAECSLGLELVGFEIQEDWKFLLVSIDVPDSVDEAELKRILRSAQKLARTTLPWRTTAYSWMVNASRHGAIVDSVFGGNLASPHSGEEVEEK